MRAGYVCACMCENFKLSADLLRFSCAILIKRCVLMEMFIMVYLFKAESG